LKFLEIGLLAGLDLVELGGGNMGRHVDVHMDLKEHQADSLSGWPTTVRLGPSRRKWWTLSMSSATPRPGPVGRSRPNSRKASGSVRISSVWSSGPNSSVPHSSLAKVA